MLRVVIHVMVSYLGNLEEVWRLEKSFEVTTVLKSSAHAYGAGSFIDLMIHWISNNSADASSENSLLCSTF